jgi:Cu-processing system ATP-binding protein
MIDAVGISKTFGSLTVLDGLDLSVRPGRVTAVVGPNAAGKTTLIKIMLGLTHPDHGRIMLDGRPTTPDGAWRARIGYMPQIARFPENLSARHLLELLTRLRGAGAGPAPDDTLIHLLGLEPQLDKPLRTLSGGTRQKVNAVMAFLFAPDLMILDEPTAGLDPISSSILKDKIALERAGGRTVVIASHIMSELEELADDVAVLLDGKVRFAGPLDELKRRTHQVNLERAIAQLMIREAA